MISDYNRMVRSDKSDEPVVVSTAAGAVGSIAAQFALMDARNLSLTACNRLP